MRLITIIPIHLIDEELDGQQVVSNRIMFDLIMYGPQISAVIRNETVCSEFVRSAHECSYSDDFVGFEVLNLSFDVIRHEDLWHPTFEVAVEKLSANGASVVIDGCSAVNVYPSQLSFELVDPVEMALKLILNQENRFEAVNAKI